MRWPPLARGWGAHGRAARRQLRRLRRRDRHLAVWGGGPRRRRLPRCGPLPGTGTRGWPSWPFELRARLGSGPREKGMLVEGAHAASVHVSFQSCERKRLIAQEIGGGNRAGGSGRPPAASPGARRHGFGSPAKTEPPSSRRMVASPLSGGSARVRCRPPSDECRAHLSEETRIAPEPNAPGPRPSPSTPRPDHACRKVRLNADQVAAGRVAAGTCPVHGGSCGPPSRSTRSSRSGSRPHATP